MGDNKQLLDSVFCDIQNDQCLWKSYWLRLITLTESLIILDITESKSNYTLNKKNATIVNIHLFCFKACKLDIILGNHAPW